MKMESKGDIGIYEKNGIKFIYKPLEINSTEGHSTEGSSIGNQSTTLKAIKDIDSFQMTIKANDVEKLLPIAKNDIGMFNRVIIGFLSGQLDCKGNITVEKENNITISIVLDVFGTTYEVKLVLLYENVGEMISLKRKVDYLTEEIERLQNTFRYYMSTSYLIFDRSGKISNKENWASPIKFTETDVRDFTESKEFGIIREFSNYELHNMIKDKSNYYKKYVEKLNDFKNSHGYTHPFICYCFEMRANTDVFIELYLIVISKLGYELVDIDKEINLKSNHVENPLSALVRKTKKEYQYIVTKIHPINDQIYNVDYQKYINNNKKIWFVSIPNIHNRYYDTIVKIEKI